MENDLISIEKDDYKKDKKDEAMEMVQEMAAMEKYYDNEKNVNTALPHVVVNIQGIKLKFLLDTGSEASYINENLMNIFSNRKIGLIKKANKITIVCANKKKIAVVDKVFIVEFKMGEMYINGEFLVMNGLPRDGIIGLDLMRKIKAKIDIEKELLCIKDTNIPWLNNNSFNKNDDEGDIDDKKIYEEIILNCLMKENELEDNILEDSNDEKDELMNVEEVNQIPIECPQIYMNFIQELFRQNLSIVDETARCAIKYEHHLEVDETKPFKFKTYPIPKCLEEQVQCEINKLLKDEIIEKGITRYINPLLVVRKKCEGQIRLVLDARLLNSITKKQFETPLNIETLLSKCCDAKIFSKLDLKSSFHLIPLSKESRKYCGFLVNGVCYRYKKVPFGLASSCAALIRAMQDILGPYDFCCTSYVDDILIYSNDIEEHKNHLELIINVLNKNGLKININKCQFFKNEIEYLGYNINGRYISVDPSRLDVIKDYPLPKTVRGLKSFLSLVQYYKRFIPQLGNKTEKLYCLLRKNSKFIYNDQTIEAFNSINKLTAAPVPWDRHY